MSDTICAIATGNSSAAIAVVRLSGPQTADILRRLLPQVTSWQPRRQTFCSLYDNTDLLDKALVTFFKAPHSFTGEDTAEFAVHGSPYIKGRLLELLCQAGARPAKRGEFSQRAFLNGKMDLVEAQGVCDLIASGNKAAHQLAMHELDGKLSARLSEMKTKLAELLAQTEVRLDDVDEEMTPLSEEFIRGEINAVLKHIKALSDTFSVGRLIKDGLRVAIVGIPNSGKSSLLNQLAGFERAIVTSYPGTTRDTVDETIEICGQKIILTDTAGIRSHVKNEAEQQGIKRSLQTLQTADIVLWVTDGSRPLSIIEAGLWGEIRKHGKRTLLVRNKTDLPPDSEDLLPEIAALPTYAVSCKTGQNIDALKQALVRPVTEVQTPDGLMISNLRHYETLLRAQTELETLPVSAGGELIAEHLRRALGHLQELLGEVTPDDVLGIIFSKFCMGK